MTRPVRTLAISRRPPKSQTSPSSSGFPETPPLDTEMIHHCEHDHDSESEHSDRPGAPLPSWLVAGNVARRGIPFLRAGHSLVSFSNRIFLFGGYCDYNAFESAYPDEADELLRGGRPGIGIHFNSLHEFSYDTGEWRVLHRGSPTNHPRGCNLPKARRHASIVVHGCSLFVYGGFDIDGDVLADLWEYNLETNNWAQLPGASSSTAYPVYDPANRTNTIPVARAEHTAVTYRNHMIVFGGYDGRKKLNDTFVFDFVSKTWSRPPTAEHNSPSRRCKHSAVIYKKKMYIVGGFQFKEGNNYALTDMHALDLESYIWGSVLMGNSCPEALQGHKAVVCGDSMYVLGGKVRHRERNSMPAGTDITMRTLPYGPSSDPDHLQSIAISGLPPPPSTIDLPYARHPMNPDNRSSGLNNSVFRYIFESNKWLHLETRGQLPLPRQLHAAVAMPTGGGRGSIFLFGGTDRGKQKFYNDLCELQGIQVSVEELPRPCDSCISFSILLDNPIFSDVTFIVEGRRIHGHRSILYARSEYFRHMFDSKMRETSEHEISISNISFDVFRAVLDFLYSGQVRVTQGRLAVDLLKAADMFRIEGLRNLCVEKVEQAVTIQNAAFICQVADKHNAQHLKTYCITFMIQNFKEVIKTQSFQTLMSQDPGGLGREFLEAYSDNSPYTSGPKRARK